MQIKQEDDGLEKRNTRNDEFPNSRSEIQCRVLVKIKNLDA